MISLLVCRQGKRGVIALPSLESYKYKIIFVVFYPLLFLSVMYTKLKYLRLRRFKARKVSLGGLFCFSEM